MHRKASIELILNWVPTTLDKKLERSRAHLMFFNTIQPTPFSKAAEKWKCLILEQLAKLLLFLLKMG